MMIMAEINKKSLEHLTDLARLELHESEKEKFLKDLEKILDHFKELQTLNTDNVQPMSGGTELKNVFREDGETQNGLRPDLVVEAFPEKEKQWLKAPPVFEE
jgi:aspartyl-tRNA(Asn)/glutamyl-tRNA(Gln) amidotransferase subunit C